MRSASSPGLGHGAGVRDGARPPQAPLLRDLSTATASSGTRSRHHPVWARPPAPVGSPGGMWGSGGFGWWLAAVLTTELGRQDRSLQQDEEQPHAGVGRWVPQHSTADSPAEPGRAEPGHSRGWEGVASGCFRTPGPSQQKQERTLAGGEAKGSGTTPRRGRDKCSRPLFPPSSLTWHELREHRGLLALCTTAGAPRPKLRTFVSKSLVKVSKKKQKRDENPQNPVLSIPADLESNDSAAHLETGFLLKTRINQPRSADEGWVWGC